MAGEKKGKAYEALTKLVLDDLKVSGDVSGEIFWEIQPDAMLIKPDLTIGKDKDTPHTVLLVTHSGSVKNSDMKFWRNIGELAEAKIFLPQQPKVFNLAFDSIIKEDLKKAQGASFDGQLIVGDLKYGKDLQLWIDRNIKYLPKEKEEKVKFLLEKRHSESDFQVLYEAFKSDLNILLKGIAPKELDKIWAQERNREKAAAPTAKRTSIRRGLTKLLIFENLDQALLLYTGKHLSISIFPNYIFELRLAGKGIGRATAVDSEIADAVNLLGKNCIESILKTSSGQLPYTQGFNNQITKVRGLFLLTQFVEFVRNNFEHLITVDGMQNALLEQHTDPNQYLLIPSGIVPPESIWLFDTIAALLKSISGKAQDFGYSTFATHESANTTHIGTMGIGAWTSCFMNQFFNRKEDFDPPEIAIKYVSTILAEKLSQITKEEIDLGIETLKEKYIAKELNAVLLSHRGFDPLKLLIEKSISDFKKISIRSCFGEKAALTGQATKTSVLLTKNTIIKWQSCTDAGRDHKRKELCGRAASIRYSWDLKNCEFIQRPEVENMFLVVDGTWRQKDIDALIKAGWDKVFYPDEIEKLALAVN